MSRNYQLLWKFSSLIARWFVNIQDSTVTRDIFQNAHCTLHTMTIWIPDSPLLMQLVTRLCRVHVGLQSFNCIAAWYHLVSHSQRAASWGGGEVAMQRNLRDSHGNPLHGTNGWTSETKTWWRCGNWWHFGVSKQRSLAGSSCYGRKAFCFWGRISYVSSF